MTSNNISISFEFFPPKTPKGEEKLKLVRQQLGKLKPDYFSVTYGAGGSTSDNTKKIVLDGEGAKKFIEVKVENSKSVNRARKISFSIANSLLVKTAIAGEDANWGRLIMAIGKTEINVQINKIKIYIQGFLLCKNGRSVETVDEAALSNSLKNKNIKILVDLAEGDKKFTAWTSDLTEEYIKINADYRS